MGALGMIRTWAVYNFPELKTYYQGGIGVAMVVVIVIATLYLYGYFSKIKDDFYYNSGDHKILKILASNKKISRYLDVILSKNYKRTYRNERYLKYIGEKLGVKEFLLKRMMYGVAALIISISVFAVMHNFNKNDLTTNIDGSDIAGSIASDKDIESIEKEMRFYITMYKASGIGKEELLEFLLENKIFKTKEIATLATDVIIDRIARYQNEYFKWYELIFSIAISLLYFNLPMWKLHLEKEMRIRKMHNEVIMFNSIILMLMHVDRMSKDVILDWMTLYADVFKETLQKCITELGSGNKDALESLKERESYVPFVRIVENMQNTDRLFIKHAFSTVPQDLNGHVEERKLDNEEYHRKLSAKVSIFIFIPSVLTVYVYLLGPLLIETMAKLTYTDKLIESLIK
jgi:hypothetical protein